MNRRLKGKSLNSFMHKCFPLDSSHFFFHLFLSFGSKYENNPQGQKKLHKFPILGLLRQTRSIQFVLLQKDVKDREKYFTINRNSHTSNKILELLVSYIH